MRSALIAVAVLTAGCAVYAADTETEHVTRTVSLAPGGTLRVRNFSGHVTITGTDTTEASIDAVRRATRDRLDHIKLDIHTEGTTLVINANQQDSSWTNWTRHNRVVETDLDIKVPKRTNVEADVFSSPVSVRGLDGSQRVHGFSSRIELDDITGPIRAHSFSGAVDIRTRTWQEAQTVDVDTFSGNIELHVPDAANGTVTFNSFSGHLRSDIPLRLQSSSRRNVRAELGASERAAGGRGSLRFKTFSGSVSIDR